MASSRAMRMICFRAMLNKKMESKKIWKIQIQNLTLIRKLWFKKMIQLSLCKIQLDIPIRFSLRCHHKEINLCRRRSFWTKKVERHFPRRRAKACLLTPARWVILPSTWQTIVSYTRSLLASSCLSTKMIQKLPSTPTNNKCKNNSKMAQMLTTRATITRSSTRLATSTEWWTLSSVV